MRDEFVECYVRYTIKFIQAYAEHGIKISAITPQNEPENHHWGRMAACVWNPETEAKYIRLLREKLDEEGLDVKIWMWDHNFRGTARVLWALDSIDDLKKNCDGVAYHHYKGDIEETAVVREKYPELKLHFTEAGPRLFDNYDNDWCKWGIMISKALRCGYSSFNGWNLMLDEMGGPNIGPFYCGGLVFRHSVTGELSYSGQYLAMKHIVPYITKASKIYPLITSNPGRNSMFQFPKKTEPVEGFMIDNGDGKPTFVMVNYNKEKTQINFYACGKLWYAELMPDSISTIIF